MVGGMEATEQSSAIICTLALVSCLDSLTRKIGLVNQVEFVGLVCVFLNSVTLHTNATQRQHCLLLREVLHKTPHFWNRCK